MPGRIEAQRFIRVAVIAVHLVVALQLIQAKYIGAEPPNRCQVCGLPSAGPSNTSSTTSRSEGNVSEPVPVYANHGHAGSPLQFGLTYNSYNADGSRAQVDTVLGFGWTHTFNVFLFDQLGAMFRFDETGRVTRYGLGSGNNYNTAPEYFETLVKNPDGSFTLTQKNKMTYTFALVPGTPFLVGGPVYRLTKITDRNGSITTLTYTSGNLTSVTDTYGRSLTYTYNALNHITSVTAPGGRVITFTYDATGRRLAKVTDPTGKTIQYTYNALYQLTTKVDKNGKVFTYTYSNNLPTGVKDNAATSKSTLSNPANWSTDAGALATNQTRQYTPSTSTDTDGRGNTWKYDYDSRGYITKQTAPDGSTTTYTYDPSSLQPSAITDPNGHSTSYVYDAQGNVTQMTNSLGQTTLYTYEPTYNNVTSVTDPRGRTTTFTYDATGNRIKQTDPLGQFQQWTYDSRGNVLTETDKNNRTTTYVYDASGNQTKKTDALSNVTTMTYDAAGNVITRTDANGHTTTYQYDALDRLTKETDANGKSNSITYDAEGNRSQTTNRNGRTTTYLYDQGQRMTKTTDATGHFETYVYDGNDNRASMTDRNSHTTTFQYDTLNRVTKVTDAAGNFVTDSYDPAGNRLTHTDANAHTTTYTYDTLNRVSTVTDPTGAVTTSQYDTGTLPGCPACGATPGSNQVTSEIDPNGKATYYKYDELDRPIRVIRKVGSTLDTITPSDSVVIYTYDPVGNRLSIVEPNGNTRTFEYDFINRQTKETNTAGDATTMTYDGVGNLISTTSPNLNVTAATYDPVDRVTEVSDSRGLGARFTYDGMGNRLTQVDGNGNTTTYTYDALDRVITDRDPLGKTTTSQYDFAGNLLRTTDRLGNQTNYVYDAVNRRTSLTDALGKTTAYQYDGVGNMIRITDANSNATQFQYDGMNRITRETYADGTFRTFSYDGLGNRTSRTDGNAQVTTYSYNDLYFLTSRTYPSAVNDTFSYDLSGRMLSAQRGAWPVTFSYDGANRVISTNQNGRVIGYGYNIPGRTRTITYPGGRVITERSDARAHIDKIDDGVSPPAIVQYAYDAGNRVTSRAYRNTVLATHTYNANNWTTALEHFRGATRVAGFGYGYDNEGNKTFEQKRHDTTRSEAYTYDATYRLITYKVGTLSGSTVPAPVTQSSYSLDAVGNWNSKTKDAVVETRVHNTVNEITQIGANGLTYDANGNLKTDPAFTYVYDEENRLVSVTRNSDSAIVGEYLYDALGRRVRKIANPAGSAVTTFYLYDEVRMIEEQNAGAVTQATYVYGNTVDEVLTMDRGGQTFYFHQNALGSTSAITDSGGASVERYSYDAYGRVTVTTGANVAVPANAWGTPHSAIGNSMLFTGRELDEETGLYYYRARYYDADKGRFLQRDDREYIDGMNLYEYAIGNPTRFVDPLGRQAGPYANVPQEELMKIYDGLASSWARLDTLARIDPNGDFAKKYKVTPQQIKDAQDQLAKMKDIQNELDRRRKAANCPKANPCQVYWDIMNIAGEFEVAASAIAAIDAISTIGSLGITKAGTEGGKAFTKEAIKNRVKEFLKKQLEKADLTAGAALLNDVLNPQKACAALAACETKQGNGAGFWQRTNYFGRAIRNCSWNNGTGNWWKSGVQAGNWVGSVPVVGALFGQTHSWKIE